MKIDLHCHTKAIKKGDGSGRNVSPELFKSKIEDADIKIVAITNHNTFDLEQYKILCEVVKGNCLFWPGVEIDVLEPDSKRWHLIVVANPREAASFATSVGTLFQDDNLEECTHTLEEIYEAFKDRDAIYIAHFHQKRPAVPAEDSEKLANLVGESYRVFKETSNENSMGVFANYRYNVLVGSDVKDWEHYEECTFSELKLPVDSFEQFCLLAKRDENVVQTLLNKKDSRNLTAHPASEVKLPVRLYTDINIIFGQKGTGKTQMIKTLCESMKSSGMECVSYVAAEREDDFRSLLGQKETVVDLSKMRADECKEDFQMISDWSDVNPTHFRNYLNWKRTDGNNANKTRMKITRSSAMSKGVRDNEEQHKCDKSVVDSIFNTINTIDLEEYVDEKDSRLLETLIGKLKAGIYRQRRDDLVDDNAVRLVNFTINTIKGIADKSTNSVSKPSTVGLIGFVETRLSLMRAIKNILRNLTVEEINETQKIGTLDEKGDILIKSKYRMLCSSSKTDEFKIGIRKLREIKEKLEKIKNHIFDCDLTEIMQGLRGMLDEYDIKGITPFVGCSKQVINEKGESYTPSTGEKGMLLLQRALMDDADAYFLDEPELGMGNSYIDTSIRPILMDLSSRHKFVVVATHNANIAVRTLPYMSIYRMHSNGEYFTYIGNPFSDKLVNIDNMEDVLNWADESLKSLEGSRDAFYERKDIYESNHTWC